jgi:hypothetical protein
VPREPSEPPEPLEPGEPPAPSFPPEPVKPEPPVPAPALPVPGFDELQPYESVSAPDQMAKRIKGTVRVMQVSEFPLGSRAVHFLSARNSPP